MYQISDTIHIIKPHALYIGAMSSINSYSAIHKAPGRAVANFAWYNSRGMEKNPLSREWENSLWRAFLLTADNPVAL